MYILFGYQNTSPWKNPEIKIYGIYYNVTDCISRSFDLDNVNNKSSNFNSNVIYTKNYTFWYKEIAEFGDMEIHTHNIN